MFCTACWWSLLPRDTLLLVIVNIGALPTLKSVSKRYGRNEHFILLTYMISTASIRRTIVTRVNTASLIFEGRLVLPVHVNAAITKGLDLGWNRILNVIWLVLDLLFELVTKKIDHHLFEVEVEFHRLYDEVRARTLFVLSSSNRGRLLGIIDLMRQKNKRMKQKDQNRIKEFYKLVENYRRFGQRYQKMKILEDLLKKIKITEDIS
ncbi:hypothetical protein Tco_0269025 [Tanacetum coccineum]